MFVGCAVRTYPSTSTDRACTIVQDMESLIGARGIVTKVDKSALLEVSFGADNEWWYHADDVFPDTTLVKLLMGV